jgi:hypothetical protein
MTIPNLYLTARKASPWYWYECYKQRDLHHIQKLYYSTLPAPGIYAITTNKHYLVAIRSQKGKKDTENIFEPAKKTYGYPTLRSKMNRAKGACSRKFSFKSTRTTLNNGKEDFIYSYYFTHSEHVKILQQEKPIHSAKYILFGTGGHLPHQKSPFRNYLITKHDNQFSQFLDFLGYYGESRVQEVDIDGFKRLSHPLRIEFCGITKRWMFSSEIKIRTEKVLMCENITCMGRTYDDCEREIWRKMFVLDDGYSWVEVGGRGKGKMHVLFRVDDETQCMKQQSKEEMKVSQWYLEREKGRFLEHDENADYMPIVRYVQKQKIEKRNDYLERIERESAELVKFQIERLKRRGLERCGLRG